MSVPQLTPEKLAELDAMDQVALLNRRKELIDKGTPQQLGDSDLAEMCQIHILLRRRSSGPPAASKKKSSASSAANSMMSDKDRLESLL